MCGPTAGQLELGDEEMAAYKQAAALTTAQYGNQQAIFQPMVTQLQSIFAKGPNQEGYSQPEQDTLNSQILAGTSENYAQAARAVNESEAAQGGGDIPLPSGAQLARREAVATSAAQEESREQLQVKNQGFEQGFKQYEDAAAGLSGIASAENPLGYETGATSSGTAASNTEDQIASEQDSWVNAALGAAGSIAGAATSRFGTHP